MGSFRRQLIAYLLMASPAIAAVCETMRPGWSPADGPATALNELIQFLLWGGGGLVIIAVILGIYFRKSIVLNSVMLVALIMAVPYIWPLDPANRTLAIAEGCIGPPTLVFGLLGAIWLTALVGALWKKKEVK